MESVEALQNLGEAPSPRRGHTLTRLLGSSTLLLFGGETSDNQLQNDMFTYNLSTSTWTRINYSTPLTAIPAGRARHTTTAITASSVVILGGDTHVAPKDTDPCLEAWLFDLGTGTWTNLSASGEGSADAPAMRGGHTTVWGRVDGQVPALYVFGGFGVDASSTVHRFRVTDWKWEIVPVTSPDGSVEHGAAASDASPTAPAARESHAAVWLPSLSGMAGMLVAGGASDAVVHDDVWLLTPPQGAVGDPTGPSSSRRSGAWTWSKLPIRMGCAFAHNAVGPHANASCILLPCATPSLLLWGGVDGTTIDAKPVNGDAAPPARRSRLRPSSHAHLIDLKLQKSARVNLTDTTSVKVLSRINHATARVHGRVYICGGVSDDTFLPCTMHALQLSSTLIPTRTAAGDFGPPVKDFFVRDRAQSNGGRGQEACTDNDNGMSNGTRVHEGTDGSTDATKPPAIQTGTKFRGRVLNASDFGTHVSVVLDGRVHKGILIMYPTNENSDAADAAEVAQAVEPTVVADGMEVDVPDVVGNVELPIEEGREHVPEPSSGPTVKADNDIAGALMDAEENLAQEGLEAERMRNDVEFADRQEKRRRVEALVNALPDEPPLKKRMPEVGGDEVITLD